MKNKYQKNKTFFVIAGFRQKASSKEFSWLVKFLRENGFKVFLVPVEWNYRTMADYVKDSEPFYKKHKSKINYVIGFSYGAVIALLTANKLAPKRIYLCSLSPDFKEDLPKIKPSIKKMIGRRRVEEIKSRSAVKIAKELRIPSVIFYGELEGKNYPSLKARCVETAKLAKNSKLVMIKNAPHKIDHPEYIKSIKNEIELEKICEK